MYYNSSDGYGEQVAFGAHSRDEGAILGEISHLSHDVALEY